MKGRPSGNREFFTRAGSVCRRWEGPGRWAGRSCPPAERGRRKGRAAKELVRIRRGGRRPCKPWIPDSCSRARNGIDGTGIGRDSLAVDGSLNFLDRFGTDYGARMVDSIGDGHLTASHFKAVVRWGVREVLSRKVRLALLGVLLLVNAWREDFLRVECIVC